MVGEAQRWKIWACQRGRIKGPQPTMEEFKSQRRDINEGVTIMSERTTHEGGREARKEVDGYNHAPSK
jgi:hypothetical protein